MCGSNPCCCGQAEEDILRRLADLEERISALEDAAKKQRVVEQEASKRG